MPARLLGQRPRRARVTTPEVTLEIAQGQADREMVPRSLAREVAAGVGLDDRTVAQLLDQQAPVVRALSTYQRNHFLSGIQWLYLRTLAEVQQTWERMKWGERRDATVVMGICVQRAMEVSGQPMMVVAGVHEHRHSFPQLAGVLAEVARRLDTPTVDGAPVDAEPASLVPGPVA